MSATNKPITWEQFRELFRRKYFTLVGRNLKLQDFLNLEQGDKTVVVYERELNCLSHFAFGVTNDKVRKGDCFVIGLRPKIQGAVMAHKPSDYSTTIQLTKMLDNRELVKAKVSIEVNTSIFQKRKSN